MKIEYTPMTRTLSVTFVRKAVRVVKTFDLPLEGDTYTVMASGSKRGIGYAKLAADVAATPGGVSTKALATYIGTAKLTAQAIAQLAEHGCIVQMRKRGDLRIVRA